MGIKARIVIWEASLPNLGSLSSHHYGVNRKMKADQTQAARMNGESKNAPDLNTQAAANKNPEKRAQKWTLPDGEPFITKEEVARRMRKPVRGIEEWMRRGIVPFYKVGQAVRFRWSEVQAQFARRYRVEAEAERAVTSEQ
jgi:excisionase family DNA binding protein